MLSSYTPCNKHHAAHLSVHILKVFHIFIFHFSEKCIRFPFHLQDLRHKNPADGVPFSFVSSLGSYLFAVCHTPHRPHIPPSRLWTDSFVASLFDLPRHSHEGLPSLYFLISPVFFRHPFSLPGMPPHLFWRNFRSMKHAFYAPETIAFLFFSLFLSYIYSSEIIHHSPFFLGTFSCVTAFFSPYIPSIQKK